MKYLTRTFSYMALCFLFSVSASQLHGQVVYTITGVVPVDPFFNASLPPEVLPGESFVAELTIDQSVLDADPDPDRGEYNGSVLSGATIFSGGYISDVDFTGGDVIVLRDSAGGGIIISAPELSDGAFVVFDLGEPFETDALPADPGAELVGTGQGSVTVLSEPTGEIVLFTEQDAGFDVDGPPVALTLTVSVPPAIVLGDVNVDGVTDFFDVSPFITVLSDAAFQEEADCNQDGSVNFFDIPTFIELLGN